MKTMKNLKLLILLSFFISAMKADNNFEFGSDDNWAEYLGGSDRNHFSKLNQITAENADKLEIAWSYALPDSGQMQTNPLVIDGVLFGISPTLQPFALDAATGKEKWRFADKNVHWANACRGVTYWGKGDDKRILFSAGPFLRALNAETGEPIKSFGDSGKVDLHLGLPASAKDKFVISNTPGTIFKDLIIMPVRLSEDGDAAPGDLRAFNVVTGKLAWTFHTIPYPGEYGYETFPKDTYKNQSGVGAVNNWAGMAIDHKSGLVFVPTGSAAYDFYGGNRHGKNLFGNCLIALDAQTGKRKWHYQFIHHDIWDRDIPSPPNLLSINQNGKKVDIVAQTTKNGYVFMFERNTGKPIHPIKEVLAPASDIPGEKAWPTQPIPTWPKAFARQSNEITDADISPYAQNKEELKAKFKNYKTALFSPPSLEGTVILPGYDGGAEWGGAAVDNNGIMYVNSNEMAWINTLKPVSKSKIFTTGLNVYTNHCQTCHQTNRKGNVKSGYPSLIDIQSKYDRKQLMTLVQNGKGMMPGFGFIPKDQKEILMDYLMGIEKTEPGNPNENKNSTTTYVMQGYVKFLDDRGLPAIKPPWGTLNALDLNTGKYLWKKPFGNEPLLAKEGILNTGAENYGGPVVTANGLLFIAAAKDGLFRIIDTKTGETLASYKLPAASFATPAMYMVNGKQYIVLACGGTKLGTPKGNTYVAFALR
jgi:quinoprotein glucose dehydrogenase